MKKASLIILSVWSYAFCMGQTLTPEQLCTATISFVNEMGINNFQTFLSAEEVNGFPNIKSKTFKSNVNFPTAVSTVIEDTTSLNKYRTAHILYARTTTQTQELNADVLRIYDNLNMVFLACLEPSNFQRTEILKGMHDKQMNYSMEVPGAFNPTMSNYLMMKVMIDVEKTEIGLYLQQIKIEFTII